MKTELGYLKVGDTFYVNGQKYKATSLGDRDIDNVNCVNVDTRKRARFDTSTVVEVKADAESEG